jgi:ferrous iron transport protein A
MPETKFLPLALAPAQSGAWVRSIVLDFGTRERLAALGLKPGRRIEVVRRIGRDGPLQVRIGQTDIVLRAQEAAQIDVEVEE